MIVKATDFLDSETIAKIKMIKKNLSWQYVKVMDKDGTVLLYEQNKKGVGE